MFFRNFELLKNISSRELSIFTSYELLDFFLSFNLRNIDKFFLVHFCRSNCSNSIFNRNQIFFFIELTWQLYLPRSLFFSSYPCHRRGFSPLKAKRHGNGLKRLFEEAESRRLLSSGHRPHQRQVERPLGVFVCNLQPFLSLFPLPLLISSSFHRPCIIRVSIIIYGCSLTINPSRISFIRRKLLIRNAHFIACPLELHCSSRSDRIISTDVDDSDNDNTWISIWIRRYSIDQDIEIILRVVGK